MNRFIYNVETYINFFSVSIEDFNTNEQRLFEISYRRNDIKEIVELFKSKETHYVIGFNNINYDDIIINYLIKNYNRLSNASTTTINKELKTLNDKMTEDSDTEMKYGFKKNFDFYKKYKYGFPPISIDLFLYWSKMLRISKKLSLNTLACNINYPDITEQPIDVDKYLDFDEMDIIFNHGTRNMKITKILANMMVGEINLRLAAHRKYGFNCYSWDSVKLGLNVLVKRYCDRTGLEESVVKDLRTHNSIVHLKDIIFDVIKFDKPTNDLDLKLYTYTLKSKQHSQYKNFYTLLEHLKTLSVTSTNELSFEVMFKGLRYDIKSGGLHSYHKAEIVEQEEGYIYEDVDVNSYYPSLGAEWKVVPKHLGNEFAEELNNIKNERLKLKREGLGKSAEANLLKLALNGGFYGRKIKKIKKFAFMYNLTIFVR